MVISKTVYLDKKKQKEIERITELLQKWELEKIFGKNLVLIVCEVISNPNLRRTLKAINDAGTEIGIADSACGRLLSTIHGEECCFYRDNRCIRIVHKNRCHDKTSEEEIIDESITIVPLGKAGELNYDSTIISGIWPSTGFLPNILMKTIFHQVRNGKGIDISEPEYKELGKAKVMS